MPSPRHPVPLSPPVASSARPRPALTRSSLLALLLLPAVLIGSAASWAVHHWRMDGRFPSAAAAGPLCDLVLPDTDSPRGRVVGLRVVHIVRGEHEIRGRSEYALLLSDGKRVRCSVNEYERFRDGGTVTARVVTFPPASRRTTAWLLLNR